MNADSLMEGEAGQSASLIPLLQSLLHAYESDVGIAKEFLQNADDAGASRIRFALDLRHHTAERLPDPQMRQLLGPALLIANDRPFSAEDLMRIETISQGAKRDQAGMTGRFGLGFNTCYHVTDYPCFATRDRITCFDPHRDIVASKVGKPGKWWSLQKLWAEYPDWPRAFDIPEGLDNLENTIFRLPLRTPAQAGPGRLQSRPFLEAQVRTLFDELERWGGSLLLFLRRILHLEVDILYPDHRVEKRLSVITENPEQIRGARGPLVQAAQGDLKSWLQRWKTGEAVPQIAVYEHRFTLTTAAGRSTEQFLVAGALLPEGEALLKAAEAMDDCGGRALPWIGAALPIAPPNEMPVPLHVTERLFCTLPLPQRVDLSFFLNGAFDLDSSRSQLTYHAKHGDREVRSRWNKALFTVAAPRVLVELFRVIRNRLGDYAPAAFYALWPMRQEPGPLNDLAQAVYHTFAVEDFLRIRENGLTRWAPCDEVRASPGWSEALSEAMLADGLALLDPQPPAHVLDGLKSVSSSPKAWTADEIRSWLRVDADPACQLLDAPRFVLRARPLVLELSRYYSVDKCREGLPLVISADGRLRAFHRGANLFLAPSALQRLFPGYAPWFVDAVFATDSELRPDPTARLFSVDLDVVVEWICHILQSTSGQTWVDWCPDSRTIPSEAWLLEILRYLSGYDLKKYRDRLRAICLLPDEHDRLHRADSPAPPLHLHEGTPEPIRQALRAFKVPVLASSSPDLVALLGVTSRKMSAPTEADLLQPLNGNSVALAITPEAALAAPPGPRDVLLDWFLDEYQSKRLSRPALDRLKQLRLWPDENGVLAAADERPLHLPTGYEPPPHLPRYRLLRCGRANRWLPLLQALGIPGLNLSTVIMAMINQVERASDDHEMLAGLRWLRDDASLEQVEQREGGERAEEIRSILRSRPIIPSGDARRAALNELYHPDNKEAAEVLGAFARQPSMSTLCENDDEREKWLRWMALRSAPRIGDILARIEELMEQAHVSGPASVEGPLLRVLQYLDRSELWKKVRDRQPPGRSTTMAQLVASLAWLPAVRSESRPSQIPGFVCHADRLYRPAELYPISLRNQIASQAPLLAVRPHEQLCEDLRLPTKVPLPAVVAHLLHVRDLWEQPDHGGLTPESITEMWQEILSRLGQPSPRETALRDQGALSALSDEPCVWHHETQRFWRPSFVFLQSIPGLQPLRIHITPTDVTRKGLLRLGVRTEPDSSDYVVFLQELAETHQDRALSDGVKRSILWAWQRLSEDEDEDALREHPPVLTRDGRLVDPRRILVDDAPWWSSRLRTTDVLFLAAGLALSAARSAGVRSAAGEIEEVLLDEGAEPTFAMVEITSELEEHLRQPELSRGLLRLLAHAHDRSDLCELEELVRRNVLGLHVVAVSSLRTALRCVALAREPFGEGEADSFLDGDRLLLALDDHEAAAHEVAAVINRRLPEELRLKDLSALEAILRCETKRIESVLDRRRIRSLPAEAEALDLSDLEFDHLHEPSTPAEAVAGGEYSVIEADPAPNVARQHSAERSKELAPSQRNHGSQILRPEDRNPAPGTQSAADSTRGASPLTPGDGTSHTAIPRASKRLRSYAMPVKDLRATRPGEAPATAGELDRAAVEYILSVVDKDGARADRRTTGHAGLGLHVEVPGESQPRHVVVKGLAGAWDRTGIALRKDELEEAQEHGESFWIYVVEHALEPTRTALIPLQDPWAKLDELRFDDGWRELGAISTPLAPAVGFILCEAERPLGEIVELERMGALLRLHFRPMDGGPIKPCFYNPSLHRLIIKDHADGTDDT